MNCRLDTSVLRILEPQLCVHWLLPHTWQLWDSQGVSTCKSANGSEACREGLINYDPIAKPLVPRTPAAHTPTIWRHYGQQHVGDLLANQHLVTYLPACIPANREPFVARIVIGPYLIWHALGNSAPINEHFTTVCTNHVQFSQEGRGFSSLQQPMEKRSRAPVQRPIKVKRDENGAAPECEGGETEYPRENPPINGIVRNESWRSETPQPHANSSKKVTYLLVGCRHGQSSIFCSTRPGGVKLPECWVFTNSSEFNRACRVNGGSVSRVELTCKGSSQVADRLDCPPHTPSRTGLLPDSRKWESRRTMPLVGAFSRGSPVSPAPSFRRRSAFTSITLIDSQDLKTKSLHSRPWLPAVRNRLRIE
ncbi:hypothetical protein PR048_007082 [Dryococelus australis]|uniref:Uncharacterized protein n=1 Tax=Dryococelus australis TaxID=614101 RepID=A0ABQ9IEV0_9NEOP|nr:hypothetical protein PR048_007082 [Dryococelus australis]